MILSKRDSEILRNLGLCGPTIGNKISKKLGIASSTVSTRIGKLRDQGLIRCKSRPTLENPHPHTSISLTVEGLATVLNDLFIRPVPHPTIDNVRALNLLGDALEKIAKISQIWKNLLPEVFGLWYFFREGEGIEWIAAERLMYAAWAITHSIDSMSRESGHLWNPSGTDPNDPDDHLRLVFTRFFYSLLTDPTFFREAYLLKWVKSLSHPDVSTDDVSLIRWVYHLKKNETTRKYVEMNLETAEAEIAKLEIMKALLGEEELQVVELERTMMPLVKKFLR